MNRLEMSFAEPRGFIPGPQSENHKFLNRMRNRNQTSFATMIDRYHSRLLHLARMFVQTEAEAEAVVREMGLKILEGVQKEEGRSNLENLLFQVLTIRSNTRGA